MWTSRPTVFNRALSRGHLAPAKPIVRHAAASRPVTGLHEDSGTGWPPGALVEWPIGCEMRGIRRPAAGIPDNLKAVVC